MPALLFHEGHKFEERSFVMSYRFNLPIPFYISLLFVLLAITYAWNEINDEAFKLTVKVISLIFFLTCIFSALQLRNGKSEPYKNVLNAIWNIETAFVFIYAISLIYSKTIYGSEPVKNFTFWAETHPAFFIVLTHLLGSVAIARAAFAFTDIFKTSILQLHEKSLISQKELEQSKEKPNN